MNTLLRRRMMALSAEGGKELIEPFYSSYPELTKEGVYILTPQTEETTNTNLFIMLDDAEYSYVSSAPKDTMFTVVISEDCTRIFTNSIFDLDKSLLNLSARNAQKNTVKMKRCSGGKTDTPLVEFYVEQVF